MEKREEATRRLAVVRDQAASAALLEKQVKAQRKEVERASKEATKLRLSADKVAPEPGARERMSAERDRLEEKLVEAREALEEASRKAAAESEAVAAARIRLEKTRKSSRGGSTRSAGSSSSGDRWRAPSRTTASRLPAAPARCSKGGFKPPAPDHRATYPRIRLTEDYFLEIAEGRDFHLEQTLLRRRAGPRRRCACAWPWRGPSPTSAGTEHSFVILDEVFGSQDVDRRKI